MHQNRGDKKKFKKLSEPCGRKDQSISGGPQGLTKSDLAAGTPIANSVQFV